MDKQTPHLGPEVQDMTLDELEAHNRDNFEQILKQCRVREFQNPVQALHFVGEAMDAIMQKFGIDVLKKFKATVDRAPTLKQKRRLLEKTAFYEGLMKKQGELKGVKVLNQNYHQQERFLAAKREAELAGDGGQVERLESALKNLHNAEHDMRRSGLYFYYKNEIAYFISNPVIRTKMTEGGIVIAGQKSYEVYTNAPA